MGDTVSQNSVAAKTQQRFRTRLAAHANALPPKDAQAWLKTHRLLILHDHPLLLPAHRSFLEEQRRAVAAGQAFMIRTFEEVADALAPYPVAALKGLALLDPLYQGGLGLRPLRDLDLLLAPEHCAPAVAALERIGFAESAMSREAHSINNERSLSRGLAQVELHSRLGYFYGRNSCWSDVPLERATICGRDAFRLTPPAQLIHLILHAFKHGLFTSLLWIDEILALSACLPEAQAEEIVAIAKQWRCRNALTAATTLLRAALDPTVLPQIDLKALTPNQRRLDASHALLDFRCRSPFVPLPPLPSWRQHLLAPSLADTAADSLAELARMSQFALLVRLRQAALRPARASIEKLG